jgi:PAS domain S-box-containing protein
LKLQLSDAVYTDALMLDADGRVLVSSSGQDAESEPAVQLAIRRVLFTGEQALSELYRGRNGSILIDTIAPITETGRTRVLGCLDLRADARSDLFSLIQSWPTPSSSAETLMVRAEGDDVLFLNDLRHRAGAALSLRVPRTSTETPGVQAVLGKQGLFEGRDYQGVAVLADLRPVAGSSWFIITKVDASEAYRESSYRAVLSILIVVLLVLLVGVGINLTYRRSQNVLYWNLLQAERKEQELGREFQTTLYSLGDAVISTSIDGAVRHMNPEAERLTGWRETEAVGRPLVEVFHIFDEDTRAEVEPPIHRIIREGVVLGLANHTVLLSRDGTERPIADSGSPIRNEQGGLTGVVLVFRDQSAERRAQRALEASEERYRSLVENVGVGIASVDSLENVTFANPAAESIFGVPSGGLAGRNLRELLSDEEFANVRRETARRIRNEGSTYEISITRADGQERRLQISVVPRFDSEGSFTSAFGTFQDITEKTRAQEALARQQALMQALMDHVPDNVYFKDLGSRFILCSRAHALTFGCDDPSELVGKTDFDFFSEEHARAAFEDEQRIIRTGEPIIGFEEKETWPDRPDTWVSTTKMPLRNARGEIIGTFGISRDITAHRKVENLLHDSEEHYRNTFMNAPFGVFHSTMDGKIINVNNACAQMLGYDSPEELKEVVNRSGVAEALWENPEWRPKFVDDATRTGMWQRFSNRYRRKDGQIISTILTFRSYAPLGASEEELEGFVEDVTDRERAEQERRKLEEQFQQAQKMEAVGRLAGGVAHDFNNILTAIYGYCEIGLERTSEQDSQHDFFQQIKQAATRAANLTSQLLAFSRRRILQPRTVDLEQLVADMMDMLKRLLGEDIDVHAHAAPGLWSIRADPGQLEQVIMNLAVNSRDAMPEGGVLTIETANAHLDQAYAREHAEIREGDYAMLAVSDSGHGMDAATQARIYEPFFTTKEIGKGTGLGLSTVYGIVKQSGGYIYCYSEVGKGTTFRMYFPRWEGGKEQIDRGTRPAAVAISGSETILFVDDDDAVRTIAVAALQSAGYTVIPARDGSEALETVSALTPRPDLLITDIVMPGLSGNELARRLTDRIPGLRVLYMSGYTEDAIIHHGMLQEDVELLQKPFTTTELLRKARSIIVAARNVRPREETSGDIP